MASTHNQLERAAFGIAVSIIVIAFIVAFAYAWLVGSGFLQIALPIVAIIAGTIVAFAGRSIYKSDRKAHAIDVRATEAAH